MMRPVRLHLFPASRTPEPVITGIGIAYADFALHIPMAAKHQSIAIGYTRTGKPTLKARFLQFTGIRSQHVESAVETTDIELTPMQMGRQRNALRTGRTANILRPAVPTSVSNVCCAKGSIR